MKVINSKNKHKTKITNFYFFTTVDYSKCFSIIKYDVPEIIMINLTIDIKGKVNE